MAFLRGHAALLVSLALASGCGLDEYAPLAPVDAPPEIDAEEWIQPPPPVIDYKNAYRAIEMLVALEGRLPTLLVNGRFPDGVAGFTPGATCCAAGGVTQCPANPAAWGIPIWEALEFSIAEDHYYVFSASSSGTELRVSARGDLDCDGIPSDIVMTCTIPNGVVSCQLSLPVVVD